MPERPPHTAQGIIREIFEPQRLYKVEMTNGYHALAVLPGKIPVPSGDIIGCKVEVVYTPYDMSRCKITRWLRDP